MPLTKADYVRIRTATARALGYQVIHIALPMRYAIPIRYAIIDSRGKHVAVSYQPLSLAGAQMVEILRRDHGIIVPDAWNCPLGLDCP